MKGEWATFTGGSLDGEERFIGLDGVETIGWPETYELIVTGEVWRHAGDGHYVISEGDDD